MDVIFPRRLERDSILKLLADLDACCNLDYVTIDFSKLGFSLPVAMLVAGSKLREWWNYRDNCGFKTDYQGVKTSIPAHSYLMHLGFFNFIYLNHGNKVGQARGSDRYLLVTRIEKPHVVVERDGLERWYSEMENVARKLGAVLTGSYDDTQELRTYSYCIREVIRNVFEHSGANECYICGQRWYDGSVEIAIVDEGVGIKTTLSESIEVYEDSDALQFAVQPGITRIPNTESTVNLYDNSGFGLFILTELAASFGWFVLGSGTAQLIGKGKNRHIERSSFSGTYFGMRLYTSPRDFSSVLSEIISAGEDDAKVFGVKKRASGRTRLIGSMT